MTAADEPSREAHGLALNDGQGDAPAPRLEPERGSATAAAVAIATRGNPRSQDYYALRVYGLRVVGQKLSLTTDVAADIVDEAMAKFLSAREERDLKPDTALGYFARIVHNEAIDRLRRRREQPIGELSNEPAADGDDAIARIIDKAASAHTIERLQAEAATRGDQTTTRVLNAYMNLAEAKMRNPTTREVAGAAQVSHTTVQNVIEKLREQLLSETEEP